MINHTHIIFILNSVFIVTFYAMRWIKLDLTCICFEECTKQLNLFYICICLYLQQDKSYETHELGHGPKFFVGLSLASWIVSEIFIFFYVFNFDVVFFIHLWSVFILSYKKINHHSIILNFDIQSRSTVRGYQLVYICY
jgi:hypothetical protein